MTLVFTKAVWPEMGRRRWRENGNSQRYARWGHGLSAHWVDPDELVCWRYSSFKRAVYSDLCTIADCTTRSSRQQ